MGWRMRINRGLCCLVASTAAWCAPCADADGHASPLVGPPLPDVSSQTTTSAANTSAPNAADAPRASNDGAVESRTLGPTKKPAKTDAPAAQQKESAAQAGAASQAMTTVGALILVVALILAAASVFKKLARHGGSLAGGFGPGGRSPAGLLAVLGRYPIAGGQTLVLLKVDRRVLLLSQTRSGRFGSTVNLSTLCEITEAEDVASILSKASDEEGRSLARTFERVLRASENDTDKTLARAATPAPVVDVRRGTAAQRAATVNERATAHNSAIAAATVFPDSISRPAPAPIARSVTVRPWQPQTGAESVEAIRRRLNALRSETPRSARPFAGARA